MKLRYDGEEPRVYPDLSLEVNPGDIVELDEPPDARFTQVSDKRKTTDEKET
jgi:hypothetical protein